MLKKPAATIPGRRSGKTRCNSMQYDGERSPTAISQNFFVVSLETMPFSQNAPGEKESLPWSLHETKALFFYFEGFS
jgi:hypothetical protein